VLEFCSVFRRKDFIQLFILYKSLPRLAYYLVNFFIDIYRKQMIQILIWGLVFTENEFRKEILSFFFQRFAPTIPIEFVTKILAYESNEICQEHLSSLGIKFIDESMSIDCKISRNNFDKN
jgi:hypothetical protein